MYLAWSFHRIKGPCNIEHSIIKIIIQSRYIANSFLQTIAALLIPFNLGAEKLATRMKVN